MVVPNSILTWSFFFLNISLFPLQNQVIICWQQPLQCESGFAPNFIVHMQLWDFGRSITFFSSWRASPLSLKEKNKIRNYINCIIMQVVKPKKSLMGWFHLWLPYWPKFVSHNIKSTFEDEIIFLRVDVWRDSIMFE